VQQLLNPEARQFILDHENSDINQLILKHKAVFGIPIRTIADQINGRRKSKDKIPSFYSNPGILYPPAINLEQSSSEMTASYKAAVASQVVSSGGTAADLTGGFGVDSFFLSKKFRSLAYVEPDVDLLEIVRRNHRVLGVSNVDYHNLTSEQFLTQSKENFDLLYIDPSRRVNANKKVFSFEDCQPNVVNLQEQLLSNAEHVMIKASPLIDLQHGINELKSVNRIIVLSVDNECKEVLFFLKSKADPEPLIEAVNIHHHQTDTFSFFISRERNESVTFGEPRQYLFEPNASILKAGAFKSVASRFNLSKLHASTHLYTADHLVENFPGRVFRVLGLTKPDPKAIKEFIPEGKANVTTRNYPLSVEELKKKTRLKDGGDKFLIGFSSVAKKHLAVAERVYAITGT
jgi:16S rRNA G966 N2-methylase RsmD